MAKRGVELNCVYYHSHPYTSERAKDKVKDLAKILAQYTEKVKFIYSAIYRNSNGISLKSVEKMNLTIIMRRFMMRVHVL